MAAKSWLTEEEKHKPVTFSAAPSVRAKIESLPKNKRSAWINGVLGLALDGEYTEITKAQFDAMLAEAHRRVVEGGENG